MRLLAHLSWATLFVMGSLYASLTMIGEHAYAVGMRLGNDPQQQAVYMRWSGKLNPFDLVNRGAAARMLTMAGLGREDRSLLEQARGELITALQDDYSSADLLLKLIVVDLKLDIPNEARFVFEQFKRIDAKSPLIPLVEQYARQQQAAPSPANPDGK